MTYSKLWLFGAGQILEHGQTSYKCLYLFSSLRTLPKGEKNSNLQNIETNNNFVSNKAYFY